MQIFPRSITDANMNSCCQWSAGHRVEHSIANAYVEAITNAQHFIYIENQVRYQRVKQPH